MKKLIPLFVLASLTLAYLLVAQIRPGDGVVTGGALAGLGVPASPGDSVQFNSGGTLAGSSSFTYLNTTPVLTILDPTSLGALQLSGVGHISQSTGGLPLTFGTTGGTNLYLLGNNNVGIGIRNPIEVLTVSNRTATTPSFAVYASNNPTPNIMVLSNGNVGIGTAVPGYPLEVHKDNADYITKIRNINGTDAGGGLWVDTRWNTAGNFPLRVTSNQGTAELLVVKGTGNVGIGTTTPANKLDVEGGLAVGATYSGTSTAPANGAIIEGNVGIGTASPVISLDVTNARATIGVHSGSDFIVLDSRSSTILNEIVFGGHDLLFNFATTYPFSGTSELMRMTTGGLIGIGTATPTAKLDVSNAVGTAAGPLLCVGTNNLGNGLNVTSNGLVGVNISAPNALLDASIPLSNLTNQIFHAGTNASSGITVRSNAMVGIGIAVPLNVLHVVGPAAAVPVTSGSIPNGQVTFQDSGSVGSLSIGTYSSQNSWIQTADPSDFSATTRLAINPRGGNVGIGTVDPRATLEVIGSIVITNTGGGLKIGPGNAYLTNTLFTITNGLDFPSVAAGAKFDAAVSLPGALDGDLVTIGVPTGSIGPLAAGTFFGWASNQVVYIRFANNALVTAMDPASGNFCVKVDKFQ